MLTEDYKRNNSVQSKMVAVLNFNQVYWFWSFLTSEPLLTNINNEKSISNVTTKRLFLMFEIQNFADT